MTRRVVRAGSVLVAPLLVAASVAAAPVRAVETPAAPTTRTVTFEVAGAQGGSAYGSAAAYGGLGGQVTATASLPVGGAVTLTVGGSDGFNGGGTGGGAGLANAGLPGGGASDVRVGGARVLVAGGGGGSSGPVATVNTGGAGGGAGGAGVSAGGAGNAVPSTLISASGSAGGGGGLAAGGSAGIRTAIRAGSVPSVCFVGGSDGRAGAAGAGGSGGAGSGPALVSSGGGGGGGGWYGGGGGAGGGGCGGVGGSGGGGSGYAAPGLQVGSAQSGAHGGNGSIRVSLDGGRTWAATYAYTGGAARYVVPAPPNPTALSKTEVSADPGDSFTVTGTGLEAVDQVTFTGGGVAVPGRAAYAGGRLTITWAQPLPLGSVTVAFASSTAGAADRQFEVETWRTPTVTGVSPAAVGTGGGTVTVQGAQLGDATVRIDGTSVRPRSRTETAISFSVPAHQPGAVPVTIGNAHASATATVLYAMPPTVSAVTPDAGPVGGGAVTITGTSFVPGGTAVRVAPATGPAVTVQPTALTATSAVVTLPPGLVGTAQLTVVTPVGGSAPLGFRYLPAPTAALAPAYGPVAGGPVTAYGSALTGATVTVDGVTVPSTSTATAVSWTMPPHAAGAASVVLTTAGGSVTLPYMYWAPPVITAIGPNAGPLTGGAAFLAGYGLGAPQLVVTVDGAPAAYTVGASGLAVRMPAHAAGPVVITVTTVGGSASVTYRYASAPQLPAVTTVNARAATFLLEGTDLDGATVTLDGTVLTPFALSGTKAVLATPGAGGRLTVTTPGGSATTTLVLVSAPAVTGVSASAVDEPFPVIEIRGTQLADPTLVTIAGRPASVLSSAPDRLTVMAPQLPVGLHPISITTVGGSAQAEYLVTLPPGLSLGAARTAPGRDLVVSLHGFVPGTSAYVTLGAPHTAGSGWTSLGTATVGPTGDATVALRVPDGATLGERTVYAVGSGPTSAARTDAAAQVQVNVDVVKASALLPKPQGLGGTSTAWLWWLPLVVLWLVAGALVLRRRARR